MEHIMNPISIVIITLNEEKRIGRLLEDLTKQTHQNFEVIVVDSNSEDSTREVAQAYEDLPDEVDFNFHVRPILSRCASTRRRRRLVGRRWRRSWPSTPTTSRTSSAFVLFLVFCH